MSDEREAAVPPPPEHHHHSEPFYEPAEYLGAPPDEPIPEREVSLRARILNWRTIGSTIFALALVAFLFRVVLNVDFASTFEYIANAIRASRGRIFRLLPHLPPAQPALEHHPAKGRDGRPVSGRHRDPLPLLVRQLRRAGQARRPVPRLPAAWQLRRVDLPDRRHDLHRAHHRCVRHLCPCPCRRILELPRSDRPEVDALFVAGFLFAVILILVVVALRFGGHRLARLMPGRLAEYYEKFHHGSTAALTPGTLTAVVAITIAVWLLEGMRVFFVIHSLGLAELDSLRTERLDLRGVGRIPLTAIPLTPAGIGFVQFGIVWALSLYGVSPEAGTAVALTDFVVATLSVIVIGGILYVFSDKVRTAHRARPAESPG